MAYNSLTRPKPWYRKAKGWVLLTFLVLTLAVIPALYALVKQWQLRPAASPTRPPGPAAPLTAVEAE